jgi:hypothetical protein
MYDISNNRLGVNTPSPSDTLHVTGNINCTDGGIVQILILIQKLDTTNL